MLVGKWLDEITPGIRSDVKVGSDGAVPFQVGVTSREAGRGRPPASTAGGPAGRGTAARPLAQLRGRVVGERVNPARCQPSASVSTRKPVDAAHLRAQRIEPNTPRH